MEGEHSCERKLLPLTAQQFGLPEDVLAEIEDTIRDRLRTRAVQIATEDAWQDRRRDLCKSYGMVGSSLQHFLANHLAREFAVELCPAIFEAAEDYVEMFTRAIIECRHVRRRIRWKLIANQAMSFCYREIDWQYSSKWLAGMLTIAEISTFLGGPTKASFICMLMGWPGPLYLQNDRPFIGYFVDTARRKIRHIALLAPRRPVRLSGEGSAEDSSMPSLADLRKAGVISQRHAALYLKCRQRTIRNYFKAGGLTRTERGFIVCDNKFFLKLRRLYGSALR